MSLEINRHPEFGYFYASRTLRGKARLAVGAMIFGIAVGACGTAVLVHEGVRTVSDPPASEAFAQFQGKLSTKIAAPATVPKAMQPSCPGSAGENPGSKDLAGKNVDAVCADRKDGAERKNNARIPSPQRERPGIAALPSADSASPVIASSADAAAAERPGATEALGETARAHTNAQHAAPLAWEEERPIPAISSKQVKRTADQVTSRSRAPGDQAVKTDTTIANRKRKNVGQRLTTIFW